MKQLVTPRFFPFQRFLLHTAAIFRDMRAGAKLSAPLPKAEDAEAPSSLSAPPTNPSRVLSRSDSKGVEWNAKRIKIPGIQWAQIGGADFVRPPREIFQGSAATAYEYYERLVYVAACPGQRDLSRELQLPIVKIGCCGPDGEKPRMSQLSDQWYGGSWRIRGGWSAPEPGWDRWSAMYIAPQIGPAPGSPVTVERHAVRVRVPTFLPAEEFDAALDAMLSHGRLWPWLGSPAGRVHCRAVGADPYRGYRGTTAYNPARACNEIYVLRIGRRSHDIDRLISIVETVIASSLALID